MSVYAVSSSDELRMKVMYSANPLQDRGHSSEADRQAERFEAADVESDEELAKGRAEQPPVDEVVEVVPPADGVVEVGRVAGNVDEKGG